jgi:DNA (cytosine-5)-methyltransferase 1
MFLVGFHEVLGADPAFPIPTHYAELPSGYEGTRATARKHITSALLGVGDGDQHGHRWIDDPVRESGLPPATGAEQALSDLPPIYALQELKSGSLRRGRKDPAEECRYATKVPGTAWSRLMRSWPGYETEGSTSGHVIRYLPRDYKIFRLMEEGWQYPDVWRCVEEKRKAMEADRRRKGRPIDRRTVEGRAFQKAWTLPYDPDKFPNKWWKLHRDRPVRTLMAHLGKDCYSHIHFDSEQARTISLREAARLQSFPDGFVFRGSMNAALKQIGNAVPPLLAYAVAISMRDSMGCSPVTDIRTELLDLDPSLISATAGRK